MIEKNSGSFIKDHRFMQNILLLASSSSSRRMLLEQAKIPFKLVEQCADEYACDWALPLQQLVEHIAVHKMAQVVLPTGKRDGDQCFVLTADTLSQDSQGAISGKPTDLADAIEKIKIARDGMVTGTAFCLDRRRWRDGAWQLDERIVKYVQATYIFAIPDAWIERYCEQTAVTMCSGAIAIEGYGGLFLKEIHGSYTTIVGLPLYEVREALEEIGFY